MNSALSQDPADHATCDPGVCDVARKARPPEGRGVSQQPIICRMVQYRGKQGFQALRAAVIAATVDTLDPRGVEAGDVPALDSPTHVHLVVFTPGESGHFTEYNVPLDDEGMCRPGTWQWPTRV